VDGSESSRAALHWAYDEAAHHDAALVAVSTGHPPALPLSPPYGHLPPEGYETQPERDAREMLERLTDDLEPREPAVDVRISISKGNPAKVLIDMSQGADLIVVGSPGHRGLRRHAAWLGEQPRRGTRGLPSSRPALIPPPAGQQWTRRANPAWALLIATAVDVAHVSAGRILKMYLVYATLEVM
jgi:nucleotide-binding universal stress UspA family protein